MSSLRTDSGRVVASEARWLAHFWERGRGWLARKHTPTLALGLPLSAGERVHSLGMRFTLQIAYCDATGKVLCVTTLPPGKLAPPVPGATIAWELVEGALEGLAVGETLLCD